MEMTKAATRATALTGNESRSLLTATGVAGAVLLAGLVFAGKASASTPDIEMLVTSAARSGHAVEGFAYNQPATAVPIRGGRCPRVGLVYQESTRHRRGPRIDHFDACPGQEPESVNDVSPALPDDPQFKQLTLMAIRGALRYGQQRSAWLGYNVATRRLSAADPHGCAQVETIVDTEGLLVSYQVGRMCP